MTPNAHAIDTLRRQFSGDIVTAADNGYDAARRVWNVMIDRKPALIVRPRTVPDVQAAVACARDQRLPLAVRGGAHGISGTGTCGDGLVIDFSAMKAISVDPAARTARAEPGVKWTEFDARLRPTGLPPRAER